jgi:UDP-N-acetyl-2-amino-2-deoxyglucuronate dehydrogenase
MILNLALVGCGRISNSHLNAILHSGCNLSSICDLNIDKAKSILQKHSLNDVLIFRDYREMIENVNLDIIIVATSSESHSSIAKYCLSKGLHLIIEKPLSLTLKDIDEIIRLAFNNQRKVTVCHQNRFNIATMRLKSSIHLGSFKKLFYGAAVIRWNRTNDYYSQDEWRGKWQSDGGALMNQSIHNIDLLLWMMGSQVVEVFGYIDNKNHQSIEVEDMGVALLKFANGSFGIIESSMNTYPENFEETLSIFGEKGTVVLDGKSVNKIVHWNVKDDPIDDLEKFNEEVDSVYGNGHIALYKDFIEAIEQDREPAITLQDGRNAVEVILAIYLSSFEKRPVQLPLPADTSTIMFEGKSFK